MTRIYAATVVTVLGLLAIAPQQISAQQVTIATPNQNLSDSFFERTGVNWSFNYRGVNASFGGGNLAIPQFGGYNPSAGLTTGFGVSGPNGNANFNFNFGQGYRQSFTTQTPMLTLMNGQTGYVADVSQTPFVVGQIPVVGGAPMVVGIPNVPNISAPQVLGPSRVQRAITEGFGQGGGAAVAPQRAARKKAELEAPAVAPPVPTAHERLATAQESSAGRAAPSVAEARHLFEQDKLRRDGDSAALMERARAAEEDGRVGAARVYYQMIIKHDSGGDLGRQAQERLDALRASSKR